jgi:hypothetical protein
MSTNTFHRGCKIYAHSFCLDGPRRGDIHLLLPYVDSEYYDLDLGKTWVKTSCFLFDSKNKSEFVLSLCLHIDILFTLKFFLSRFFIYRFCSNHFILRFSIRRCSYVSGFYDTF